MKHVYDFDSFVGYSVHFPDESAIEEIEKLPEVEFVEKNYRCAADAVETQKSAQWNLARITQRQLQTTDYAYDDLAGSGVDIYVLDTGVFVKHSDFGGRASFGASFSGEDPSLGDQNGHGTHVAGNFAIHTVYYSVLLLVRHCRWKHPWCREESKYYCRSGTGSRRNGCLGSRHCWNTMVSFASEVHACTYVL